MSCEPLSILVSGMLAGVPHHGGATWAVLQYVLGLRQLGHDVWFVEPVDPAGPETASAAGPEAVAPETVAYFDLVCRQFDLQDRAALLIRGSRQTIGLPWSRLAAAARDADLLLNLSGLLREESLCEPIPSRLYLDLDPAFTQLWHDVEGIDMGLAGHTCYATVGTALGSKDCPIPTCGVEWIPTLQPVVLDEWPVAGHITRDAFTTIANWRGYGSVQRDGVLYGQKVHALREFIDLPRQAGDRFDLGLAIDPGEERDLRALERGGWNLVDPYAAASTPDRYRRFIAGSLAEVGIAKSGYALSRSGWFSDRSACYLASGRPVLAMETGFSRVLPTGVGLLSFQSSEEALAGIHAIRYDYARQSRAAREIAEAYFDSRTVLSKLLERVTSESGEEPLPHVVAGSGAPA